MALTHTQRNELRSLMEQRGEALRIELGRDMSELQALEAARKRLAFGTYGICCNCCRDIEYRRLRAEPGATFCAECELEMTGALRSGIG